MGQEITAHHFLHQDFERFRARLKQETELLHDWVEGGRFARSPPMAGLELEAWLIHPDGTPAPRNEEFLRFVDRADVVHELARFNVEINAPPQSVTDAGLARLHADLGDTWSQCRAKAQTLGLDLISIGILPTLKDSDLCPGNMSASERYRALNEQVLRQRHGRPIVLDIDGVETLRTSHLDVMLEAGTTSFQGHLQVTPETAVRYFNASIIASAATVALGANSPFLFGRRLWEETRIPLFEQAVAIGSQEAGVRESLPRVSFGTGYAGWSLVECFRENADRFPIMLPIALGDDADRLAHLRLHNGTIWRWNRPLIGFDDRGTPHLRIEHRVMAAGPSVADMMANLVFYYGLAASLAAAEIPPESHLPFAAARENFYAAARLGLGAVVVGIDGSQKPLREEILGHLLPAAHAGLALLGATGGYTRGALNIIEERARSGRTGSHWQSAFAKRCDRDFGRLTREYAARQRSGAPVHEWSL
jgi:gamma-glutamyl:cysteine ligase YbdK (ATP-grasp superfamily)